MKKLATFKRSSATYVISRKFSEISRRMLNKDSIPSQAQVVIIGGGIIGASVAYHLTKMGMKDVMILEQSNLTAGTTWHAAGLMVTFGSLSETSTELRKYTRELYSKLESETGQSTGFRPVGFIELVNNIKKLSSLLLLTSLIMNRLVMKVGWRSTAAWPHSIASVA
jgi:hypothetical protein